MSGPTSFDGMSIALDSGVGHHELVAQLSGLDVNELSLVDWVSDEAVEQLKFSDCLPDALALRAVTERLRDDASVQQALSEPRSTYAM